jgi:hypothetical protein
MKKYGRIKEETNILYEFHEYINFIVTSFLHPTIMKFRSLLICCFQL